MLDEPKKQFSRTRAARSACRAQLHIPISLPRHQPFKPFRDLVSSGAAHDVLRPQMAWVTNNDLFVGIDYADDGLPADARI